MSGLKITMVPAAATEIGPEMAVLPNGRTPSDG